MNHHFLLVSKLIFSLCFSKIPLSDFLFGSLLAVSCQLSRLSDSLAFVFQLRDKQKVSCQLSAVMSDGEALRPIGFVVYRDKQKMKMYAS